MPNLTKEQAWTNLYVAARQAKMTRDEHDAIETSAAVLQEYLRNSEVIVRGSGSTDEPKNEVAEVLEKELDTLDQELEKITEEKND